MLTYHFFVSTIKKFNRTAVARVEVCSKTISRDYP